MANDLAIAAAREGKTSSGAVESEFLNWLRLKQEKGRFPGYDPDVAFEPLERRLEAGENFALAE